MRNSLTFRPDFPNGKVEVTIGNAGGGHGMTLSLSGILAIEEWIAEARHDGTAKPLVITQGSKEAA